MSNANPPAPTIEQSHTVSPTGVPQMRQAFSVPPPAWPIDNPNPDLAIKAPVRVATTGANITLSGLQTIDGVALAAGDRVLVKDQTSATSNGLYNAATGAWQRTIDGYSNSQWITGTQVSVTTGAANAGNTFQITAANPVTIGTSNLTFGQATSNDASAVAGSAAKFFNPAYFGTPASGLVDRFNRVLVGVAALASSDIIAGNVPTTKTWFDNVVPGVVAESQLVSISALGNIAVAGISRASDNRMWLSSAAGGATGGGFFGVSDDPVGNPTAGGVQGTGIALVGAVGALTFGAQFDMNNASPRVDVTPHGGITGGVCEALLLTSGAFSTLATTKVSAAVILAQGFVGGPTFRKGLVCLDTALDVSGLPGEGGQGIAIEMATGQTSRALDTSGTTVAAWWGDANGFNIKVPATGGGGAPSSNILVNGFKFLGAYAAGSTTSYNEVYDSAGNAALLLGGGGGSPDAHNYYRNTSHNFSGIAGATFSHFLDASGAYINSSLAIAAGGSADIGVRLSSTAHFGIFYGSGAPSLSAAQGSLYLRSDGAQNARLYINTNGTTGWATFNTLT